MDISEKPGKAAAVLGVARRIAALAVPLAVHARRLAWQRRANMGLIFGLTLGTIVAAVGAGIDLGRAYLVRQQLSAVANLSCQYANRNSVVLLAFGENGPATYQSNVASFVATSVAYQKMSSAQTNVSPFSYTGGGAGVVSLSASVPTSFMGIVGIAAIPVTSTVQCFSELGQATQPVSAANPSIIVSEGFENTACTGTCYDWYLPNGTIVQPGGGTAINPVNSNPGVVGYVGLNGTEWVVMGYCIEIDSVGLIRSNVPQGTHSAELDCDNDQGTAGNSSISTKTYLSAGSYELRWNYASRIDYPMYDPVYICGNSIADTSWANAAVSFEGTAVRTNQINVYLDQDIGGTLPTHTTIDGTQTLGGSNLIDTCVYSENWIQRSVKITVTKAGNYWLSFAADGHNDSYGGQIDNIMLCNGTCSGSVQDNFPTQWLPASNGGSDLVLFEDTFESPTYTATSGSYSSNGNLNNSLGTSGNATSGWPSAGSSGWATAPTNRVRYWLSGSPQGSQSVQLDQGSDTLISRPFLLVPGYYEVNYDYIGNESFSSVSGVYCGATPTAAGLSQVSTYGSGNATYRLGGSAGSIPYDTEMIGVFMSHAQETSTPITGGALGSTTSYLNPDGSTSTTPTVAPNAVSISNYNASQLNPLLDICGYATSAVTRTAYVKITKTAYYWLTLAALGSADSFGGSIDDVKVTALGSLYMSGAPSNPVTIPVPDPQPGSTLSFTGFSITADPLTP